MTPAEYTIPIEVIDRLAAAIPAPDWKACVLAAGRPEPADAPTHLHIVAEDWAILRKEFPQMPRLRARAAAIAQTLRAAIAQPSDTPLLAPEPTRLTRHAICHSCPERRTSGTLKPGEWTCAACGCFGRAKIALAASTCPLGKW